MLRYGTYIFGGDRAIHVVIDDGLCSDPTVRKVIFAFRVIGVEKIIRSQEPGSPGGSDFFLHAGTFFIHCGRLVLYVEFLLLCGTRLDTIFCSLTFKKAAGWED